MFVKTNLGYLSQIALENMQLLLNTNGGRIYAYLARKSRKCSGLQFFSLPTENCREADKPARKPISILISSFVILSGDWITSTLRLASLAEGTDVVGVTDRCWEVIGGRSIRTVENFLICFRDNDPVAITLLTAKIRCSLTELQLYCSESLSALK